MDDIYIVILEDRHVDVQVFAYTVLGVAMNKAKEIITEYDFHEHEGFEYKYTDTFLFAAPLSCEGDHLSVNKIPLNNG